MKLIIAGSRIFNDYPLLYKSIKTFEQEVSPITEIVCGCCKGADQLGNTYATRHGVPVKKFPAEWMKHGKSAGPLRNKKMVQYGDALLLFWDGKSKGSASMLKEATKMNLIINVVHLKG